MGKYEYLTGEDLGYKSEVVEKAKLEYSPLGEVFNKWLEKEDKKERLLKRLNNVEDINKKHLEKQLEPIENEIDIANKKAFKKLRVLNGLNLEAK